MAGTISRGIKAPIIRQGDDIVKIAADAVLAAAKEDGFTLHDRDVVCVTEAVVARADGNYASTDDIAADVPGKVRRWNGRRGVPDFEPEQVCDLPAWDCKGRKKGCASAQLPVGRGGQPSL